MSIQVEPNDWAALDPWWSAYTQTCPVAHDPATARALDSEGWTACWEGLDSWWQAYPASSFYAGDAASTRVLLHEHSAESWDELDAWWDVYTDPAKERAVEIADLLKQSNEEWRQSAAPFDTDPLASAVTRDRGPLLPSNEEGWSTWLARVLQPSAALVTELFDVDVSRAPSEVLREKQLSKAEEEDGSFRRADILTLHADRGVSIEVKLDDRHYEKTEETAKLIERKYPRREWTHALLLPERNLGNLRSRVEPLDRSDTDERPQIEWDNPEPVSVICWRDVAAAIRTLLRRGDIVDDHWAANAYLFCAAIEQQIMHFQPQHVIDDMADPADDLTTIQRIAFVGVLGEQLTYLRSRQNP